MGRRDDGRGDGSQHTTGLVIGESRVPGQLVGKETRVRLKRRRGPVKEEKDSP